MKQKAEEGRGGWSLTYPAGLEQSTAPLAGPGADWTELDCAIRADS